MIERKIISKIKKEYCNRVKECRLQALMAKQEELAKVTGINRSTINALENNRLFLSSYYALVIAEALGCSVDNLYDRRKTGINV